MKAKFRQFKEWASENPVTLGAILAGVGVTTALVGAIIWIEMNDDGTPRPPMTQEQYQRAVLREMRTANQMNLMANLRHRN